MGLQELCGTWHTDRFPNHDRWLVLAKLTEEVGELARAIVAEHEGRPGRGDIGQEAGQCALVLMTLMARFYPSVDLMAEANREYLRLHRSPDHAAVL